MEHLRRLTQMYHAAPITQTIPSCLTLQEGRAEVHMRVSNAYWHSADALHGSMYFKALDDAAFFAANSVETTALLMTARFEVTFLKMIRTASVKAIGIFERRVGKKLWASAELFDELGTMVGRGQGLFVASNIPLADANGYLDADAATKG